MRETRTAFFVTGLMIICLGIVMIYSSSGIYAMEVMGNSTYFLIRHLIFLSLGILIMLWMMSIDYRQLEKYAKPILVVVIVLLILVLIPGIGKLTSGARRWFSLGFFNFQPSELAKPAMIIYLASYLTRKQAYLRSGMKGFLPIVLIMGLLCALIIKQPDLGNTVLIFLITMTMYFIAGGAKRFLGGIFLMALPIIVGLVIAAPYRMRRMVSFFNPWEDAQGAGFQLSQSQIALGSGGFFGVGLGKSEQKLFYLPAAHTDFIFSIIGEELGFLGAMAVIFLFVLFFWFGIRLLKAVTNPFGYYLVFGVLFMLAIQSVVNVGVSIGALPTKGLPLPFISYGGSALIFNMAAIGLVLNVSRTEDMLT